FCSLLPPPASLRRLVGSLMFIRYIGTLTMGYIADRAGMSLSFLVPMAGYAVVLLFAMYYTRHKD
ncbi:MAG: hypothetical protein K2I25_05115, partial [Muribaculaceae bacterium]|nr:hypothetical protein [Muribaculaceae bacterium]